MANTDLLLFSHSAYGSETFGCGIGLKARRKKSTSASRPIKLHAAAGSTPPEREREEYCNVSVSNNSRRNEKSRRR
jgi:hypothetical protein